MKRSLTMLGLKLERLNRLIESKKFRNYYLVFAAVIVVAILIHSPKETGEENSGSVTYEINSSPQGARIYLYGEDTGHTTPATIEIDPTQNYEFDLRLSGYKIESFEPTQGSENRFNVLVELKPID